MSRSDLPLLRSVLATEKAPALPDRRNLLGWRLHASQARLLTTLTAPRHYAADYPAAHANSRRNEGDRSVNRVIEAVSPSPHGVPLMLPWAPGVFCPALGASSFRTGLTR